MKYDDMEVLKSYNYESNNVTYGKIGKKRKYNPLDIAIVSSICGVLISTTVLLSRLMTSGVITTVFGG